MTDFQQDGIFKFVKKAGAITTKWSKLYRKIILKWNSRATFNIMTTHLMIMTQGTVWKVRTSDQKWT